MTEIAVICGLPLIRHNRIAKQPQCWQSFNLLYVDVFIVD